MWNFLSKRLLQLPLFFYLSLSALVPVYVHQKNSSKYLEDQITLIHSGDKVFNVRAISEQYKIYPKWIWAHWNKTRNPSINHHCCKLLIFNWPGFVRQHYSWWSISIQWKPFPYHGCKTFHFYFIWVKVSQFKSTLRLSKVKLMSRNDFNEFNGLIIQSGVIVNGWDKVNTITWVVTGRSWHPAQSIITIFMVGVNWRTEHVNWHSFEILYI